MRSTDTRSWGMNAVLCVLGLAMLLLSGTRADASDGGKAANGSPPGLAVVDVGQGSLASDVFLDLLQLELERTEHFQLVERAGIRQLLREQALSLSLGAETDSEQVLQLGQLVTADLFLLAELTPLDAENDDESETALRLRLVESRYGLKLADDIRLLKSENLQDAESEVSAVAGWVEKHARRLKAVREQPNIVAVSSFHIIRRSGPRRS